MHRIAFTLVFALSFPAAAHAGKTFDPDRTSGNQLLEYLDHGAWDFRLDAAKEIKRRCITAADAQLATLVDKDPNTKVRLASLVALDHCRMESALVAAEAAALVDSEAHHRRKAISIIEEKGNERSGPVLAQVLEGDPDVDTREKAATVLRKRAWKGAEVVQEAVAKSAQRASLRVECVHGLLVLDTKYRSVLHAVTRTETNDKTRLAFVKLMESEPRAEDKGVLLEMLDDGYSHVARHAARALGNLGDRSVAPVLRDKSMAVTDRKVAEEFAEQATRLGG